MQRDKALLWDIEDAGRAVVSYVSDMMQDQFLQDRRTQKAVTCEILVMGEAVKKLSPDFRNSHNHIPWSKVAGMRDKLVHDYHRIDLDRLWIVARRDIPELLDLLAPLLEPHE